MLRHLRVALACALVALTPLASWASTTTTIVALSTTTYADLGAGPLLLGATGGAVIYQVADTQPVGNANGFVAQPGAPLVSVPTTAHVWARATSANTSAAVAAGTGISAATSSASYALATNVSAAGNYGFVNGVNAGSIAGVVGASYILSCAATTWNSASVQLQALGPDNVTWLNVGTTLTSNGTQSVVMGASATVRAVVTGTPTNENCNLS